MVALVQVMLTSVACVEEDSSVLSWLVYSCAHDSVVVRWVVWVLCLLCALKVVL